GRARRAGGRARRHAVRRPAPAPLLRARDLRGSRRALSRRAHRGHGRGGAPGLRDQRADPGRGRQDHRVHQPLPARGGGARAANHRDRPRPRHRGREPAGAERRGAGQEDHPGDRAPARARGAGRAALARARRDRRAREPAQQRAGRGAARAVPPRGGRGGPGGDGGGPRGGLPRADPARRGRRVSADARGATTAAGPARRAVAPLGRMLLTQARSEIRTRWRIPAFSVTIVALPVLFFTFFGLPYVKQTLPNGTNLGAYLVASFAAYSVGSVMVFGFGIGVSTERGLKVDVLMRATLLSLVVLIVYAVIVGGVRQDLVVWADMVARLLAGSVPFIALGFAIGYTCGPNVAPAAANLVYLPLSFASGLFLPLSQLPGFVRAVAPYLPAYHYGQLAWSAVGAATEPMPVALAWLAGYTALFLAIAFRAYRREESRKFG